MSKCRSAGYIGQEIGRRKEEIGGCGDPQEYKVAPHPVLGRSLAEGRHGVDVGRHLVDVGPVELGAKPQWRILIEFRVRAAHAEPGHA